MWMSTIVLFENNNDKIPTILFTNFEKLLKMRTRDVVDVLLSCSIQYDTIVVCKRLTKKQYDTRRGFTLFTLLLLHFYIVS